MSDTPRTDEHEFRAMMIVDPVSASGQPSYVSVGKVVVAALARQLERELVAAQQKITDMELDQYNSMVERSLRNQ